MSINGIGAAGYPAWAAGNGTRKTQQKTAGNDFANQMGNVAGTRKKEYKVYMKTDDMLYSGGNGSGLSFYIKYAEGSTEEDPTVVAKGVDENGNEFEQTIHINDINPRCATLVQMRALEAYLGVDKDGGLSSLPKDPSAGNMGLHDRGDFINMFQKQIRDMNTLGERRLAAYYRYSMQMYWDFMLEKGKGGNLAGAGMGSFLSQLESPLQHKMQEQSAAQESKRDLEESKSDSEIVTQPDGSKTLVITNQIGGMQVVTSIELTKPNPLSNNHGQDLEEHSRSAIETDGTTMSLEELKNER